MFVPIVISTILVCDGEKDKQGLLNQCRRLADIARTTLDIATGASLSLLHGKFDSTFVKCMCTAFFLYICKCLTFSIPSGFFVPQCMVCTVHVCVCSCVLSVSHLTRFTYFADDLGSMFQCVLYHNIIERITLLEFQNKAWFLSCDRICLHLYIVNFLGVCLVHLKATLSGGC